MTTPEFWLHILFQTLVRGALSLLVAALAAALARRASAACRALVWRTAFSGLLLLPILPRDSSTIHA